MINRKGAKNLLEKALPIKMPVDHYFTRDWELGIKFTGVENPNLVHQTFGDSDIERTTKVQSEKNKCDNGISSHPLCRAVLCYPIFSQSESVFV
jgi:hypothetical protein